MAIESHCTDWESIPLQPLRATNGIVAANTAAAITELRFYILLDTK